MFYNRLFSSAAKMATEYNGPDQRKSTRSGKVRRFKCTNDVIIKAKIAYFICRFNRTAT